MKRNDGRNLFTFGIILFLVVCLFFGSSCTSYRNVVPPSSFPLSRPSKPTLFSTEGEEIPSVVLKNTVLLMKYSEELEIYIDGLEEYYGI